MEQKEERNWVVFCNLGGLITVSFLSLIIPLVIWLLKKNQSAFIEEQGKEIVNYQVSLSIYFLICAVVAMTVIGMVIAVPAMFVLFVLNVIFVIKGAISASNGEKYLYPMNLRLIK